MYDSQFEVPDIMQNPSHDAGSWQVEGFAWDPPQKNIRSSW